jgi:hypothetical protein
MNMCSHEGRFIFTQIAEYLSRSRGTGKSHCMDACYQTSRHAAEHEYMHKSGAFKVGEGEH